MPQFSTIPNHRKKRKSKKKYICHYGPTNTYAISSPLGEIVFTCCQFGLHRLQFKSRDFANVPNYKTPIAVLKQMWCDNGYTYKPALKTVEWIKTYFFSPKLIQTIAQPPVCKIMGFKKGSFQEKFLLTLRSVPFGNTISYNQLIREIGGFVPPTAVQSVIELYPLDLIAPYHRIVTSDYLNNPRFDSHVSRCLLSHETLH